MEQYNRNELVQPNTLVWGILSLALPGLILNLIFGVIGRKKGKAFLAQGGKLAGASKVGFILSKVGVILSIIALVVIVLYAVLFIVLITAIPEMREGFAEFWKHFSQAFQH